MTTIAVNPDMMAGDTQYSDGGIIGHLKTKIYRINGDILGYAGSEANGVAFMNWYKDQSKDPPDFSDTTIMVLKKDGSIWTWEGCTTPTMLHDHGFYAIGEGAEIAMGAMYAGATPEAAVRIAIRLNPYTGGKVRVLRRK